MRKVNGKLMLSSTSKRRVFVGLPISEKLQKEIFEWEKQFSRLPVRWLRPENFHITLVPPFYADNEEIEKLGNILEELTGFGSFAVEFGKVTFGPRPLQPRLIWAEGETPQKLLDLQQKIDQILGRVPEKRPLKLHLTLARFRPESFSSFEIQKLDEKIAWADEIKELALFESKLSRDGASYQIIREISL